MSKDRGNQRLIPTIRFKGFTDDWEQRKLLTFVERVTKQSESRNIPSVEYEDIQAGVGSLNKDVAQKTVHKRGVEFQKDDILFGKLRPYLDNRLHASFSGIAVGDFWILRSTKSASNYTYALIQADHFRTLANQTSGTKMPRSDWSNVSNEEYRIPKSMREQSEIGKLFDTLDETIALHQRKYENLQAVKKELLKRMFASDKKPVPDFRFNGYTNDWEQRKLGDIAKFYSGGTPAVGNAGYYNGGIPFIRSAELSSETTELTITESGLKNSSAKLVNKGNLLYAMYGATSGEVGRAGVNGAINQAILAILPNVGYEVSFVQQWLIHSKNSIVGTYLQGGQGNLSSSIIKKLSMSVPSRREQEKISTLLSTIDGALALHQRKLEDLKQLKKVLLQKLFV